MRKEIILLSIVVIGVCFICGCVNQSQSQSRQTVVTPAPALKTHYALNEPATDGTLRITVLGTRDSFERSNTKTFHVSLKLENLKSGTIHMLSGDFQLLDENNNLISPGHQLGYHDSKYDLLPNQREQTELFFYIYPNDKGKTIKYDFIGSSGKNSVVYFDL